MTAMLAESTLDSRAVRLSRVDGEVEPVSMVWSHGDHWRRAAHALRGVAERVDELGQAQKPPLLCDASHPAISQTSNPLGGASRIRQLRAATKEQCPRGSGAASDR